MLLLLQFLIQFSDILVQWCPYMGVNPRGPGGPGPPPNILAEGAQQLAGPPNISAPQT